MILLQIRARCQSLLCMNNRRTRPKKQMCWGGVHVSLYLCLSPLSHMRERGAWVGCTCPCICEGSPVSHGGALDKLDKDRVTTPDLLETF